jgi:polar amino acid transport system substrate-binding protein
MIKRIGIVFLFAVMWFHLIPPATALSDREAVLKLETLNWYTEEYPPFNFKAEDGLPTGMAVDILVAAFKRLGGTMAPADIKIAPWNRAYKYLQNRPKTALFSMTYTPERQRIMKFVGPIIPSNVSVIALKDKTVAARTAADLSKLKIGVARDDIGDQLIQQQVSGEPKIIRKNSLKQLIYLLERGRVDVIAYAAGVFGYAIKMAGRNPEKYEEIMVLKKGQLGFAFHIMTPNEVLAPLQKAIDDLKADGTIQAIIDRYRR